MIEDQEGALFGFRFLIVPIILTLVTVTLFFGSLSIVCAPPPPPPNNTPPSIYLMANPTEICADGSSTSTINASVWDGEWWIGSGPVVNFSTDLGEITASVPLVNKTAAATLTAGTVEGIATITVESDVSGIGLLTNTTTVNFTTTEFDTGAGAYPSIAGTHKGVIRPTHPIVVKKLYTYPCAGTGGHFESVTFYNVTTEEEIANATWGGYQGDYHNLTFPEQFTLAEGEDYRYVIVTGAYPQIIHEPNCTTLDGSFINCTLFEDVNGDVHDDWIPAFRLG